MRLLYDLALLYLTVAQSGDATLGNAELEAVTDSLAAHFREVERAEVQNLVFEALTAHTEQQALRGAAHQVVEDLGAWLTSGQKAAVLDDLRRIAGADGVVLDVERDLLATIAAHWAVQIPPNSMAPRSALTEGGAEDRWGARVDLAFIYLVLAHGTDRDLSEDERHTILKRLREWRPLLTEDQALDVLEQATERYAQGVTSEMLTRAVERVRVALPLEQRKAALDDLVRIANADGVFLDSEEDLINDLVAAWGVTAYTGYGDPGTKAEDRPDG